MISARLHFCLTGGPVVFSLPLRSLKAAACSLALLLVNTLATAQSESGATEETPEPTQTPRAAELKPGYNAPDAERDPFFSLNAQFRNRKPVIKDPSAQNLLAGLKVIGIMGKPETPDAAGVLIGNKIYHVSDTIPISYGDKEYKMVLVAVRFPDKVDFRYKDDTVTLTVGKKNQNGD